MNANLQHQMSEKQRTLVTLTPGLVQWDIASSAVA